MRRRQGTATLVFGVFHTLLQALIIGPGMYDDEKGHMDEGFGIFEQE